METDLQLAKTVKQIPGERRLEALFAISPSVATLCPFQENLVRLQIFVIRIFPFRVPFTIAAVCHAHGEHCSECIM